MPGYYDISVDCQYEACSNAVAFLGEREEAKPYKQTFGSLTALDSVKYELLSEKLFFSVPEIDAYCYF